MRCTKIYISPLIACVCGQEGHWTRTAESWSPHIVYNPSITMLDGYILGRLGFIGLFSGIRIKKY